jgi:hypothetical protein
MPNTTSKEMLASGQWTKHGKDYHHVSGVVVKNNGDGRWLVNGFIYDRLWAVRHAVEKGLCPNSTSATST